jgi:hypothetical protein
MGGYPLASSALWRDRSYHPSVQAHRRLAINIAPRYYLPGKTSDPTTIGAAWRNQGARMEGILLWLGRIAGIAGLGLSVWAAAARLQGAYFAGGFQIGTLLMVGITGMIIACFCLLVVLTMRPRQ